MKDRELKSTVLLLIAALIWGVAFVAQEIGAGYVDAFTFLSMRSWLSFFVLLPVIAWKTRAARQEEPSRENGREDRRTLLIGGACTGFFLFAASAAQQIGIATTTAGKSSFITAMYVVLVPVVSVIFRKRPPAKVWFCVVMAVAGLYLLCMSGKLQIVSGDLWTLLAALLFAFQILLIHRFVGKVDGVKLTCAEFFFEAVLATACVPFFAGGLTADSIVKALPSILYAGLFSGGIGYTLQTLGEKHVSPPIASLAMCMESVFGALAGWLILHERFSVRELSGCGLMFLAILLAELPIDRLLKGDRHEATEDL